MINKTRVLTDANFIVTHSAVKSCSLIITVHHTHSLELFGALKIPLKMPLNLFRLVCPLIIRLVDQSGYKVIRAAPKMILATTEQD
jgi:hypothetical protein